MRKVTRYHCEFCGKGHFLRKKAERHERGCTLNPSRVCRFCSSAGLTQKPLSELLALVPPDMEEWTPPLIDSEHHDRKERDEPDLGALRSATGNCPACIFAAIRQKGAFLASVFDWKSEAKAWIEKHPLNYDEP